MRSSRNAGIAAGALALAVTLAAGMEAAPSPRVPPPPPKTARIPRQRKPAPAGKVITLQPGQTRLSREELERAPTIDEFARRQRAARRARAAGAQDPAPAAANKAAPAPRRNR